MSKIVLIEHLLEINSNTSQKQKRASSMNSTSEFLFSLKNNKPLKFCHRESHNTYF